MAIPATQKNSGFTIKMLGRYHALTWFNSFTNHPDMRVICSHYMKCFFLVTRLGLSKKTKSHYASYIQATEMPWAPSVFHTGEENRIYQCRKYSQETNPPSLIQIGSIDVASKNPRKTDYKHLSKKLEMSNFNDPINFN